MEWQIDPFSCGQSGNFNCVNAYLDKYFDPNDFDDVYVEIIVNTNQNRWEKVPLQ